MPNASIYNKVSTIADWFLIGEDEARDLSSPTQNPLPPSLLPPHPEPTYLKPYHGVATVDYYRKEAKRINDANQAYFDRLQEIRIMDMARCKTVSRSLAARLK